MPDGFAIGGYDQWALIHSGLFAVVASLSCAPWASLRLALLAVPVAVVAWGLGRLALTFELRREGDGLSLTRRVLGVAWSRRTMPAADARLGVDGNGEYGEPGGWPASENCYLCAEPSPGGEARPAREELRIAIGPAWAADEILRAVQRETERLAARP